MSPRAQQLFLGAILALLFSVSLFSGRMDIYPADLWGWCREWMQQGNLEPTSKMLVFFEVRLPRSLTAALAGTGLAMAGAAYQGIFRNPLVSPDILGVSAGCALGAAIGLVLPGSQFGLIRLLAFALGLSAVGMAVGIARAVGVRPILVLILAGLVVTSMFNALLMLLKYAADPYSQLPAVVFWIMGSLHRATWNDVQIMAPVVLAGVLVIHILRFKLNILSLGDVQAVSLGLSPRWYRFLFISISSLMVAVTVSACGQIGWIGLVIPHMARTWAGPDHRIMLPVTGLTGGAFLLGADLAARSLSTAELPVSILTALIGGPVFALLLYRNRARGWM
ncbi:MAG: FecCD family ABC transporter permease [Desulfohalobiaceae bacterium]